MCRYKGRDGDENEPVGGWNDRSIIYKDDAIGYDSIKISLRASIIYKNLDELPDTGHA